MRKSPRWPELHGCVILIDCGIVFRRRKRQGANTVRLVRFKGLSLGGGCTQESFGVLKPFSSRIHFSHEVSFSRVVGTAVARHAGSLL